MSYRPSDPDSSILASEECDERGIRERQQTLVLRILTVHQGAEQAALIPTGDGMTAGEMAQFAATAPRREMYRPLGGTENEMHITICRRLPELENRGKVRRLRNPGHRRATWQTRPCRARGRAAQMWWLA